MTSYKGAGMCGEYISREEREGIDSHHSDINLILCNQLNTHHCIVISSISSWPPHFMSQICTLGVGKRTNKEQCSPMFCTVDDHDSTKYRGFHLIQPLLVSYII